MNKRHYEHTLPNIRGSLSNTYGSTIYHVHLCHVRHAAFLRKIRIFRIRVFPEHFPVVLAVLVEVVHCSLLRLPEVFTLLISSCGLLYRCIPWLWRSRLHPLLFVYPCLLHLYWLMKLDSLRLWNCLLRNRLRLWYGNSILYGLCLRLSGKWRLLSGMYS